MRYRIQAGEFGKHGFDHIQQFVIEDRDGGAILRVHARIRTSTAATWLRFTGRSSSDPDDVRLGQALALLALPLIESKIRDGSAADLLDSDSPTWDVPAEAPDLDRVGADLKACRYRVREGGDDYCDAGCVTERGIRERLPTSRATCDECPVPDARLACSNLHHVRVTSSPGGTGMTPVGDHCDWDKPHNSPKQCAFRVLQCWERLLETAPRDAAMLPPLAVHESVDFLNSVWRNAFGTPLLKLALLGTGGVLATPCKSSQEFQAKLSALGEVFNAFDVQEEVKGQTGSLAKMKVKLANWGRLKTTSEREIEEMEKAVSVLQRILAIRAGQQHGNASDKAEAAMRALGLSFAPQSYADEWIRLQSLLHDALADVRRFITNRL